MLNQYLASGLGSQVPFHKKVGKEYRDKNFEDKIMSDKGVILGILTVELEGLFQIKKS